MLVISSMEFGQNQQKYFEKVDNGEQVIVQSNKKSYALTSVDSDDIYLDTILVARIKESIQEIEEGKVTTISNAEEVKSLLGL